MGKDDVRKTWKEYFEDLHIVGQVTVNVWGFDGARSCKYFSGELVSRTY